VKVKTYMQNLENIGTRLVKLSAEAQLFRVQQELGEIIPELGQILDKLTLLELKQPLCILPKSPVDINLGLSFSQSTYPPNSPCDICREEMQYKMENNLQILVNEITEDINHFNQELTKELNAKQNQYSSLEKKSSLLQSTLESTNDGILVVDTTGKITCFNHKFVEMWNISEAIIHKNDRELIKFVLSQLKDSEAFINKVNELYNQPDLISNDILEFKDGRVFERYSQPQKIGNTIVGRLWSFRDITEQKNLEKTLRESEQWYRNLIETARGGIWIIDQQLNTKFANKRIAQMLGYTPEEMEGMSIFNFMDREYGQICQDYLTHRQEGIKEINDFKFQCKDGTEMWAIVSATPQIDSQGKYMGSLAMITDITERKQNQSLIEYQAFHDHLTGLPNRVYFNQQLPLLLQNAAENNHKLAVMFLDIDRFKIINDTLGHAVGDILLQTAAERVKNCLRSEDVFTRWGGDEFTLIFPKIEHQETVAKIAQRILDALKATFTIDGHKLHISGSIGIGIYPDHGCDAETLLKNADAALYRVKESGRNNYQFYTAALNSQAEELLLIENELYQALQNQEFVLHYQPQINAKTGEIIGMEALLRWHHPQWGLVAPDKFIPLAEETGLIVPISEWVLKTACAQNKTWQNLGLGKFRVAVNISSRHFQEPKLLETVKKVLAETQLSPQYLELEITEYAAMINLEKTCRILDKLSRMGVNLSIDDFGTGYSSLAYLKHFPLDQLKIDKSFIDDLTHNLEDVGIVKAIITLAKGLNIKVMAEGVETIAQKQSLLKLGCEEMQGYLFSKPLSANEVACFLMDTHEGIKKMTKTKLIENPEHSSTDKQTKTSRYFNLFSSKYKNSYQECNDYNYE
jgi:diguanylate cyclase (GGDEF)-like protein/PAS domain S-box-containing protein